MYVSVEASKLTFPKGAVLFSLEGLTTQRKAKPSRGPASREESVDFLNDGPATRFDQHDAVTRIHVAILGERRTPVSGHRFQFDVSRHPAADHDLLLRGHGPDLVFGDVA